MSSAWNTSHAKDLIQSFSTVRGGLLPALHGLQEEFGYVDEAAIPLLAQAFNLSTADVFGVITFYHDFRRTQPGRHTIQVCRGEACQSMGGEELLADIEQRLNVSVHGTTSDGEFSLEQVFCLGNCALSPSVMVDQRLYGRVTPERFVALAQGTRAPGTRAQEIQS